MDELEELFAPGGATGASVSMMYGTALEDSHDGEVLVRLDDDITDADYQPGYEEDGTLYVNTDDEDTDETSDTRGEDAEAEADYTGEADPDTATPGSIGDIYLNTVSGEMFTCTDDEGGYTWEVYDPDEVDEDGIMDESGEETSEGSASTGAVSTAQVQDEDVQEADTDTSTMTGDTEVESTETEPDPDDPEPADPEIDVPVGAQASTATIGEPDDPDGWSVLPTGGNEVEGEDEAAATGDDDPDDVTVLNDNTAMLPCICPVKQGDRCVITLKEGEPIVIGTAGWGDNIEATTSTVADDAERLRAELLGGLMADMDASLADQEVSTLFYSRVAVNKVAGVATLHFSRSGDGWALEGEGGTTEEVDVTEYGINLYDYTPSPTDTITLNVYQEGGVVADLSDSLDQQAGAIAEVASGNQANAERIATTIERLDTLDNYITTDQGRLKIANGTNAFYVLMSSTALTFYGEKGKEVAWIASEAGTDKDSEMFINDVNINDQLRMGGYEANQRSDGSVYLKWVG